MNSQELEEGEIKEEITTNDVQDLNYTLSLGRESFAIQSAANFDSFNRGKNIPTVGYKNRTRKVSNNKKINIVSSPKPYIILPYLDRDERLETFTGNLLPSPPGPIFRSDNDVIVKSTQTASVPIHTALSNARRSEVLLNLPFSSSVVNPVTISGETLKDIDLRFTNLRNAKQHVALNHSPNRQSSLKYSSTAKSYSIPKTYSKSQAFCNTIHPVKRATRYQRAGRQLKEKSIRNHNMKNIRNMPTSKDSIMMSIQSVDKDASYEDLLEQYKRIQLELNHLKTEEAQQVHRHNISKGRKSLLEKDYKHRKKCKSPRNSVKDVNSSNLLVKPNCKSKSPNSATPVNQEIIKSSISIETSSELPRIIQEIENNDDRADDDDIMELRRKALESRAQQVANEKELDSIIANSVLEMNVENQPKCPSDNYDMVDMDLCSDVPETQITDLSEMEMDTEDNESDQDEDINHLREQLLKALESRKKDSPTELSIDLQQKENLPENLMEDVPLQLKELGEIALEETVVKDRTPLEETSQRIEPPKKTLPETKVILALKQPSISLSAKPKMCQKLVINLADDSSSSDEDSSEEDGMEKKTDFVSVLDSFLREAKEKVEIQSNNTTSASVSASTPTAVSRLSKAQQLEYRKLKEELIRRKLITMKGNPTKNQSENSAADAQMQNETEKKQKRIKLAFSENKLKKERASLIEDDHRVKTLNQSVLKKSQSLQVEELKLKQLKLQLAAAEKSVLTSKQSLKTVQGLLESIQKSALKKQLNVKLLEKECVEIGKDVFGPSYAIPATVDKPIGRRKSIGSNSGHMNMKKGLNVLKSPLKRTQIELLTERERLQKLEQEVAQRLVELKSKSIGSSLTTAKNSNAPAVKILESPKMDSSSSNLITTEVTVNPKVVKVLNYQIKSGEILTKDMKVGPGSETEKTPAQFLLTKPNTLNAVSEAAPLLLNEKETNLRKSTAGMPENAPGKSLSSSHMSTCSVATVPNETSKIILQSDHSEKLIDPKLNPKVVLQPLPKSVIQQFEIKANDPESAVSKAHLFNFSQLRAKRKINETLMNAVDFDQGYISFSSSQSTGQIKKPKLDNHDVGQVLTGRNTESTSVDFPYVSPLYHLKSYRLSPHCQIKGYSSTFVNKLNPREYVCKFSVAGTCNDEDCQYQHLNQTMSLKWITLLSDIVSYCPELAGVEKEESIEMAQQKIAQFCKNAQKKFTGATCKVNMQKFDEIYQDVLKKVKSKLELASPYYASVVLKRKYIFCNYNKEEKNSDLKPLSLDSRILSNNNPLESLKDNSLFNDIDNGGLELDRRYFEAAPEIKSSFLEKTVQDNPRDTEAWLNLAKCYLNEITENNPNRINKALDTMSRALEANQDDEQLWQYYLTLYGHHPESSEDYESMFEQSLEYVNSYNIWWRYFLIVTSYEKKFKVGLDIINYLILEGEKASIIDVKLSHHLLEILFNLVQLTLLSKKQDEALRLLQVALDRVECKETNETAQVAEILSDKPILPQVDLAPDSMSNIDNLFFKPFHNHLTTSDQVMLWLVYIYFGIHKSLPPLLLEQGTTYFGHFVLKEHFLICFPTDREAIKINKLLFEDSISSCAVNNSLEILDACVMLYSNWTQLEINNENYNFALDRLRKILVKCPNLERMWIIRSVFYGKNGCLLNAEYTLKWGLVNLPNSTKLVQALATLYIQTKRNTDAKNFLDIAVKKYFVLDEGSKRSRKANNNIDTVCLYQVLLNHIPNDDSDLTFKFHKKLDIVLSEDDKGYLWICYVLLLQSKNRPLHELKDVYENALLSVKTVESKKFVFEHYFQTALLFPDLIDSITLVKRCFEIISPIYNRESGDGETYLDYTFHNCLIDQLCEANMVLQAELLQDFFTIAPDNLQLLKRLATCFIERGEKTRCFNFLSGFLENTPGLPELWIIYINLALENTTHQEVHCLYGKALALFPMCVDLWQNYIDYEKSQKHPTHVEAALERARNGLKLSLP